MAYATHESRDNLGCQRRSCVDLLCYMADRHDEAGMPTYVSLMHMMTDHVRSFVITCLLSLNDELDGSILLSHCPLTDGQSRLPVNDARTCIEGLRQTVSQTLR